MEVKYPIKFEIMLTPVTSTCFQILFQCETCVNEFVNS